MIQKSLVNLNGTFTHTVHIQDLLIQVASLLVKVLILEFKA